MAKGQSPEAQQARLAMQCCPNHGLGLGQVSGWLSFVTEAHQPNDYSLGCCPRADCDVVAKITSADFTDGPATLVTEADVHPEMWRQAVEWLQVKRTRGPKSK